jgi:hypothetical protein
MTSSAVKVKREKKVGEAVEAESRVATSQKVKLANILQRASKRQVFVLHLKKAQKTDD